jgi:hypothetical protein
MLAHAVDYACWRMLWITGFALCISQPFVLGRIDLISRQATLSLM